MPTSATWPFSPEERKRRPLLVEQPIRVRSYDIDSANHVSNIVYLRWMEDMRWLLCETHFPLQPLIDQGVTPIITSTHIEYKRPVRLFDQPQATMHIDEVSAATMKFRGEVYVNGQLATRAVHVGVFIDMASMKPVKLPKEIKDRFESERIRLGLIEAG